tara:strand:+ start:271 stop:747 length:477 start_codon:yes stop_codon:yes gene_type:complete
MQRKYSHISNIINTEQIGANFNVIRPGMILQFTYTAPKIYDKSPMILFLYYDSLPKLAHGINLNYLTKYKIKRFFDKLGKKVLITRQDPKIKGGDKSVVLTERYVRASFKHRGSIAKSERKRVYENIIKDKLIITDDVYRTYKKKYMTNLKTVNYEFK